MRLKAARLSRNAIAGISMISHVAHSASTIAPAIFFTVRSLT